MAAVVPCIPAPPKKLCRKVFLGLYDSRSWPEPDSRDEQRVRDFMVQKYENKRWYVAPTESMKDEARRMNEVTASKPTSHRPLRSMLGESAPKLVVQNNQSPQMNRPSATNPGPIGVPPITTQSTTPPQPTAPAQPKPQPGSGFDLLGELGGDPFASTPRAPVAGGGGFADFSSFGSQPNPTSQPPPPSAFPMSSAPLQPMGSATTATAPNTASTPTQPASQPAAQPPPSQPVLGGGDRYAALADLDSVFGTTTTSPNGSTPSSSTAPEWTAPPPVTTVNWGGPTASCASSSVPWGGQAPGGGGGSNVSWNGTNSSSSGSAQSGWNSQPPATATSTSASTAANPFGGGAPPTQTPAATQANPFGAGGQAGFQQSAGFGQFPGQPAAQPAPAAFGQFGMQNGAGFGTTAAGFGFTQSAPAGANPGIGAQPQAGFPAAQQPGFPPAQQPQGFSGGWGQAAPPQAPQPAGNPFMNAAASQQQIPPRSSSTNPFL